MCEYLVIYTTEYADTFLVEPIVTEDIQFVIFIANVATSIATPVAGLFMVLILWKKELYEGMQAPKLLQVSMTVCYIFALYMTWSALQTQVPKLINSFIGG